MKNGEKCTCLDKHAFDVNEMSITSIITRINMTRSTTIDPFVRVMEHMTWLVRFAYTML